MAVKATIAVSMLVVSTARADVSASLQATSPYGALASCDYYRDGCGVPVGLGGRVAIAVPRTWRLEAGLDLDTMVVAPVHLSATSTIAIWRPVALASSLAIYPEVALGVSVIPRGFERVVPYYDFGAGLLWRLDRELWLRADVTLRGMRVGILFD